MKEANVSIFLEMGILLLLVTRRPLFNIVWNHWAYISFKPINLMLREHSLKKWECSGPLVLALPRFFSVAFRTSPQ